MKRIAAILSMSVSTLLHAQESGGMFSVLTDTVISYDTSYVKSFRDNLVVTLVSAANSNSVAIEDSTGKVYDFAANLPVSFGIGLDYKWLTAEYTTSFGNAGDPKRGETKAFSLGFGLTMRKFWFRNFYQQMQGYHLDNPTSLIPEFNPSRDNYPYRSDVRTSVYYASINYGFNHRRFSNMAALWQLERQRKSAGSFTMGLSYAYNTYNADSALVPSSERPAFISKRFVTGYFRNMVGFNIGYLYTIALAKDGRFFINLALIPGLSYQHERAFFDDDFEPQSLNGIGVHTEARGAIGFNGDRIYSAFSISVYAIESFFEGQNPASVGYGFSRLVLGYKFDMPKTKSPLLRKFGL